MLAVVGPSLEFSVLFALTICTHKIKKNLPHLKAIIQYLGNPPAEEGVYEVSPSACPRGVHGAEGVQ